MKNNIERGFSFDGVWQKSIPLGGYTKEELDKGIQDGRNPLLDENGNVILEGFLIPIEDISIKPIERKDYVTISNFWVVIDEKYYGFMVVDFPKLNAMEFDNLEAYVRLLRCKLEGIE